MNDLINYYRHDGKRWWSKDAAGKWWHSPANSIARALRVDHNVCQHDMRAVLQNLKTMSQSVMDPAWREEVAWLVWTKNCRLRLTLGKIEFFDLRSGRLTRSMPVAAFNRLLRERFPLRKPVVNDCLFAQVFP